MTWRIQLPTGDFLDTPQDLQLQFELNNQVFTSNATSSLPGSYSFPVEVPLTPRMRQQLSYPHRIDNAARVSSIEGACAYAGGVRMFPGTLKIFEVDLLRVKISLISNPVAPLKEKNLPEIDLEGERTVAPTSWPDYMLDTANKPEDYDHAFFHVYNDNGNLFNIWDDIAEEFLPDLGPVVTPFVRLDYLLDRMFRLTGYQFANDFQSNSLEMGRLYVFNNVDARILTTTGPVTVVLPDALQLNKHLPPINCAEFLKKLAAQWCLGLFTNIFEETIALTPLKDVLARAPKHDWTQYAMYNPIILVSEPEKAAGYYNYPQPNTPPQYAPPVEDATLIRTFDEFDDLLPSLDPGYYYLENNSNYFQFLGGLIGSRLALCHRGLRVGTGDDYESGMEALLQYLNGCLWNGPYSGFIDDGGYRWEQNDFPVALMFYRGLQDSVIGANRFTVNSNSVWRDRGGSPGDKWKLVTDGVDVGEAGQSLNWFGDYGVYNIYHKAWSEMLRNNKHLKQTFHLPVTTVTSFSFQDKVRVGNIDYFVKSLRVQNLLDGGLLMVEASLISVI